MAFDYRVAEGIQTIYSDHNKGGLLAANEIIKNDCKCVLNVTAVVTDKSPLLLIVIGFFRNIEEKMV